jgi:hypothetical protein
MIDKKSTPEPMGGELDTRPWPGPEGVAKET